MKANMTIQEFEKELQLINKDLAIRPNNPPPHVLKMYPDTAKLAAITLQGVEVCTIPNNDIYEEANGNYGVEIRDRFIRHRTRPEALAIVKDKLALLESNKEESDAFFGRGEYSDSALRKEEAPVAELIDEVSAEAKPVQGGMLE